MKASTGAPHGALRKQHAARWLDISDEAFQRYVVPHVRCVRLGSMRLYQFERFLDERGELPLEDR